MQMMQYIHPKTDDHYPWYSVFACIHGLMMVSDDVSDDEVLLYMLYDAHILYM